jgi:hypothetical protein
MLESEFKLEFIQQIKFRVDPLSRGWLYFIQPGLFSRSMPDLVILGSHKWAALEFKQSEKASQQPNQDYHIDELNGLGYARFVYPENAEEVLDELEELFAS